MTLVERLINVSFTLAKGNFVEGGGSSNTVKLTGLRTQVNVQKAGGPSKNFSEITIYGMPLSLMNQLSTLGMVVTRVPKNTVLVEAGDASSGMSTVFGGTIYAAWADFNAAPQVAFRASAQAGLGEAVISVPPLSFPGRTAVSVIMSQIAKSMGLPFENNLPNEIYLMNPYLPGTAWEQMKRAADAAGIGADVDDGVLVIYTQRGPRKVTTPIISPGTGMIGYPTYSSLGIIVRTLFNPAIRFHGTVQVQGSILPQANGTWLVIGLDHDLASFTPNGRWESLLQCYDPKAPTPVPQ